MDIRSTSNVSVVVPSYNHVRFVRICLRSIFKQTIKPKQLLVIDDGSEDDSPNVIADVLKDCPFPAELIARENRGLGATLNQGLSLTDGEYFCYLASDDLWLPDFLAARVALLKKRPSAVLAYGHAYLVDSENNVIDSTADWATYADGDARAMLKRTTAPMSPTVVHVRKVLEKFGWNEQTRLEDFELYLKLSLEGEFAFDQLVLSAWRWHEGNTSRDQRMMLAEHLRALRKMAPQLGLSTEEMARLEKKISFERAKDFLSLGEKRAAMSLVIKNLSGSSPATLGSMGLRLLVPSWAMRLRRERSWRKNRERYEKLC